MTEEPLDEITARLSRLEDESAVRKLILSYGPAADAKMATFAGQLWADDGVYDWDGEGEPYQGGRAVERMLQGDQHRDLVANGVAHFAGPPLIELFEGARS